MSQRLTVALLGLLGACCAYPALSAVADPAATPNPNEPSVDQVFSAARAGHYAEAKKMMTIVLADHPRSARAHYVMAELDADMKNYGEARDELKAAETIAPGLPSINPHSVAALSKEIGAPPPPPPPAAPAEPGQSDAMTPAMPAMPAMPATTAPPVSAAPAMSAPATSAVPAKRFPWTIVWVVAAVLVFLWLLFRRRPAPAYATNAAPVPATPPPGGFPNVVAGGSGIVGGLASGLAVGAGIAAGEELVRGFESHHGHEAGAGTPMAPESPDPGVNSDMGGPDFGVSDPGGGWEDGGSGGGDGGGGDWT
ncbi:MAG TPA: tetratricopeptide repeat protein [Steroidobacteraceae bacterium]|jgi:hypothetical protein